MHSFAQPILYVIEHKMVKKWGEDEHIINFFTIFAPRNGLSMNVQKPTSGGIMYIR